MLRRHFFLIGAALLVLVLMVAAGAKLFLPKPESQTAGPGGGARAAPVTLASPVMHNFEDVIEVLGAAKGRQAVTLTSNTSEVISQVLFKDGDRVRKGQVLVQLQSRQEDAAVSQAQANLDQARRTYERWKNLADQGVAPKATAEQYLANVLALEGELGQARAQRSDRAIRAPFAGRVGLTDVAPGTLISPGTAIVTLDDITVMRVDFDVPERLFPILKEGMLIQAQSDALPGRPLQGRIVNLDSRIDAQTRAITVRAEFANPAGLIKPGMLMRVSIRHGSRQAVAVPQTAVQFEGDRAFAFVVSRKDEAGPEIATRRDVTVGGEGDGFIEILGGLTLKDQIVLDGLNRLQDGAPVRRSKVPAVAVPGQPGASPARAG